MWNLPVLWKLIFRKETLKSDMTFNNQWERDCVNMLMISVATWGHVTFRFIYIFVLCLSFLFRKTEWGTMFFPRVFIMEEVYSMSISVCHMKSLSNYTFNWCGCPRWTWYVLSWTSQRVKSCPYWWAMAKLGVTPVRHQRLYSTREAVLPGEMDNSWTVWVHKPLPGRFLMVDF